MLQKAMHVFLGLIVVFIFGIQSAWAVSFGRMDVASHLAEPFYAEVPLRLGSGEKLRKTSVEIGSTSDYRILEVYRDQIINSIRTDIVDDERGARVKISSEFAIDTAFFNLVLKVRYGRATHYKKIPIFLESASKDAVMQGSKKQLKTAPGVNSAAVVADSSDAFVTKVPAGTKEAFEEPIVEEEPAFTAHSDWARTSRYGPMVYGDTITTVAKRLRLDDRFTNQQVMVALFNKNKSTFSQENINLIKVGAYLDVPSAAEVNQISIAQAKNVISEQNKVWRNLVKQPKFAAVANAQKMRYTQRVRIGKNASGVASAPMLKADLSQKMQQAEVVSTLSEENKNTTPNKELKVVKDALALKNIELTKLKKTVNRLKLRLDHAGQDTASIPTDVTAAALDAQNKRLEIIISRLKNQLEQAKTLANEDQGTANWVMYAIAGLGLLVLSLLAAVVVLLRRTPTHPAQAEEPASATTDKYSSSINPIEELDSPTANPDNDATMLMNADEFEMPSETMDEADPVIEDFDDIPLEEIPDLTDEETGEMEAFDSDALETPDPSVNYLEEAEVYMRYGMEDEAEKQVHMALKLQEDNPEAHAKLVSIQQSKGNAAAADKSMAAAKAILSGAALATFEAALSGDASAETSSDEMGIADLPDPDMDPDATGIMDFGEIDFNAPAPQEENDDSTPSQSSADGIDFDFSAMAEGDDHSEADDQVDDNALDFGGLEFSTLDSEDGTSEGDSAKTKEEIGFADLDSDTSTEQTSDVMQDEIGLDSIDLDFGSIDLEDTSEPRAKSDALGITDLDSDPSIEAEFGNVREDNVEEISSTFETLETSATGSLDFGELDIDLETAANDVATTETNDEISSDTTTEQEDVAITTGELANTDLETDADLDFGDLDSFDLDTATDDAATTETNDEISSDTTTEQEDVAIPTGELTNTDLETDADLDFGDLDSFDLDTTADDVAATETNDEINSDTATTEQEDIAITTGEIANTDLETDADLDFGDLDSFDLDTTADDVEDDVAAAETNDEINSDTATTEQEDIAITTDELTDDNLEANTDLDLGDLANFDIDSSSADAIINNLDVAEDKGIIQANSNTSDEFNASASLNLDDLDIDLDSFNIDDLDLDSTSQVPLDDETAKISATDASSHLEEPNDREVDIALAQAEEEANAVSVTLDTDAHDPFTQASTSLESAESERLSNDWDEDALDSIKGQEDDLLSLNDEDPNDNSTQDQTTPTSGEETIIVDHAMTTVDLEDNGDEQTDESTADEFAIESLDPNLVQELDNDKVDLNMDFAETMGPDAQNEVKDSDDLLSSLQGDLDTFDVETKETDSEIDEANEFGLEDFDLDDLAADLDINLDDLDGLDAIENIETNIESQDNSLENADDLLGDDATVVLDRNNLPDTTSPAADEDPMMDAFESTSELDGLMNDLEGLLDEDEPKQ